MFKPEVVRRIAHKNEEALQLLARIGDALEARFWEMEDPILAVLLSVASNEPLLLVGKPGTGKSRLIRAFCETVGLVDEADNTENGPLASYLSELDENEDATGYFEYLLTPFTEPIELFGPYNIEQFLGSGPSLSNGRLERIEKGAMHNAYVVYLDEVFNASSAILNSLLTFLNERMFHDRGERKHVHYKALFAATNQVPESGELAAVYDRFLFRCQVENAKTDQERIGSLLRKGWPETYGRSPENQFWEKNAQSKRRSRRAGMTASRDYSAYRDLFPGLLRLRNDLRRSSLRDLAPNPASGGREAKSFYSQLIKNIAIARNGGFSDMSNRRVIKMLYAMLIHCMYRSVNDRGGPAFELGDPEIELMPKFFYDRAYEPLVWK